VVSSPEIPIALQYGIAQVREILADKTIAVLTGAGVSTDSGIPDYRGAGRVKRHPLTFDEFLASEANQARYWARSYVGWNQVAAAKPNYTHQALSDLEKAGKVQGLVTQNVDGLHQKAGSKRIVELHGRLDRVVCVSCEDILSRDELDSRIFALNPDLVRETNVDFAPDGDAEVEVQKNFRIPRCGICGGSYKPDVVFFGEQVPRQRVEQAEALISSAGALVVAGSSLTVNSGLKLAKLAKRQEKPVVVINLGETKADSFAAAKLNASVALCLRELFGEQ